jgi:hypothetical protein
MNPLVKQLELLKFDQLLDWLADTLAGKISLASRGTPDESPSVTLYSLLRQFQGHPTLVRNLENACRELIERFSSAPAWSASGYEKELLVLGCFLGLPDIAPRLAKLVRKPEQFRRLPLPAQRTVLNTLHDLDGAREPAIWRNAAKVDPANLGLIAFSALLKRGLVRDAQSVLVTLPDAPHLAAMLPTFLRISSMRLAENEKANLNQSLSSYPLRAKPLLQAAVEKWLQTQPALTLRQSLTSSGAKSPLLMAFEAIIPNFTPKPESPVLGVLTA